LEAWSGQTVGKRLAGVQVYGPVRAWPSALAVAGRTLLRVVDLVPVMCLAGFITMLTTGGQQRIGDLAARTAAARAAAARYRAMAAVPLAAVVLAAVGLSAYRATSPETTLTYRAHGVWLGYPAGWQEQTGHTAGRGGGAKLWRTAVGPGTPATSALTVSAMSTATPLARTPPVSSPASGRPGNGGPGAKVVPAPAGFALSHSADVHNGPMSAADFNQYLGAGNLAASLHFVRGYDVTYDSTTNSDSIEVTLFQFATPADAANFKAGFIPGGPISSRADQVIPGAEDYDSTAPYQGAYDHGVVAAKGNWAFVLDDVTESAAPVPLVDRMARLQFAALPAPGRASAQPGAERITSYAAWITIQRDGSILVTEKITYDLGSDQRHGIFRVIPVRLRHDGSYDRLYLIAVRSVRSPDAPDRYTVQNNGSSVRIRIGDPNRTITGQHTYTLSYLVRGSLTAIPRGDKLSWNAVGTQWDVPIDRATVQVSAPVAVTRAACFAGPFRSARSCQRAGITDGIAHFAQAGLGPHEGLTAVVAIPQGAVASVGPILQERWTWQRAFAVTPVSAGAAGGLLAVLAATAAVVLARRRDRRHPGRYSGPAAPVVDARAGQAVLAFGHGKPPMEPAPPADLRPGQVGTLLNAVVTPRDVTGTIVDLAVRRYLRIEDALRSGHHLRPDWRLVRLKKSGGLLKYEQILLDGLFEGAATRSGAAATRLSELAPAFARRLKHAQDALYADAAERGWFTARPDRVRRTWLAIGAVMFAAGLVAVIVAAAGTHHLGLVPVPVALAGGVLIAGARWMPVRTAEGTALARRVAGFRNFLRTTTATQAQPAGQPDTLYDYLPYAIIFGCTQQWAALTAAQAGTERAPSWYRSSGPFSPDTFCSLPRLGYYFSTFHHFTANTSSWTANHAPSTGGGFSGGGDFSGGGGGGGGGGSW